MGKGGSASQPGQPSDWTSSRPQPVEALLPRDDFFWDDQIEPHATRRRQIQKAHPEVKKLFGHEWRSKYICIFFLVIPQIWLSWATQVWVKLPLGCAARKGLGRRGSSQPDFFDTLATKSS